MKRSEIRDRSNGCPRIALRFMRATFLHPIKKAPDRSAFFFFD